jgi:hypothetical protein
VYSQWSFAELHALISYKAVLAGSLAVKVDADYTSHADPVGARNVTLRTLLVRQDWIRTGCLSLIPDASDREAKAARLSRYGSRCGGV